MWEDVECGRIINLFDNATKIGTGTEKSVMNKTGTGTKTAGLAWTQTGTKPDRQMMEPQVSSDCTGKKTLYKRLFLLESSGKNSWFFLHGLGMWHHQWLIHNHTYIMDWAVIDEHSTKTKSQADYTNWLLKYQLITKVLFDYYHTNRLSQRQAASDGHWTQLTCLRFLRLNFRACTNQARKILIFHFFVIKRHSSTSFISHFLSLFFFFFSFFFLFPF